MVKILQKDEAVLRKVAPAVTPAEFGSTALKKIIADMTSALEKEDDGVAIAAPQIGISKRIFIISHRAFESGSKAKKPAADVVCINPEIMSMSKDKKLVPEGCLSVRWLYGNTRRASRAKIKAHDVDGKEFIMNNSGLLAQIFQHEIDHLNGILFIDHAKDVKDLPPEILPEKD
jgi:peptide deformylase